ncbi:helix-turn-helix domain-containing protein [Aequorivita capsosiphonis]|uniref:helix-turn-helix domain-containing protein n=1 Tax=Aequorivita capsosiphonis TaxID=487317 RepID=UPI0004050FA0|nr:helix-turn-helix domain-containing protein [Aequorivita capsosiphonis]
MNVDLTFDQLPEAVSVLTEKVRELTLLITEKHQPTENPERLLTVQETAEFFSLSIPTIYSKVSRGELPYMKRGKRLYFSRKELLEYLKDGRQKTNAEIEAEAHTYLRTNKKGLNNGK